MRIWVSRYALQPRSSLNAKAKAGAREGALIRIETAEGEGFADLHPWTELGDLALDRQLEALTNAVATPLTHRTLAVAELDREARAKGLSAFQNLTLPRNHYLATDVVSLEPAHLVQIHQQGYPAVKVKLGRDVAAEVDHLKHLAQVNPGLLWRFDFNGALTPSRFEEFARAIRSCSELVRAVEFIEDPVAWDPAVWSALQEKTGLSLALDRGGEQATASAAQWLIVKPAIQDPQAMARIAHHLGWRIAVTSYLDHPLGQVAAALEAARLNSQNGTLGVCGLASQFAYEKNEFSERLEVRDGVLLPPAGIGLGFDDLLMARDWTRVR